MLKEFWEWSGITPLQYAENPKALKDYKGVEEFDYPDFLDLIRYGESIIDLVSISEQQMDDLLTILAIDNEAEDMLDYAVDHISSSNLNLFIQKGIEHMQPNARWQIVEVVSRRKPKEALFYLQRLCNDSDSYVRKRAYNAIQNSIGG